MRVYAYAYVNVYAYVCHEGFGTSSYLSGRRISVIDGTAASLGGGRDPTTSRGDIRGWSYASRDAYGAKSGRVRSDRRDTWNYVRG